MQQALQLQTQGQGRDQKTYPNDKRKVAGCQVLPTKSGHAPTGFYLKRFGHRDDDKCWWCGWTLSQTWEPLVRHCSRWRDHQKDLCKEGGKATGLKASRCRHVPISKLVSIEECNQAVMDFLAATEVGKFAPK